jgi:hypothetical protein
LRFAADQEDLRSVKPPVTPLLALHRGSIANPPTFGGINVDTIADGCVCGLRGGVWCCRSLGRSRKEVDANAKPEL